MHVEQLLQLESLDLALLWGERPLLTREISGVTATDLEDPARFLQQGEIVLSGLVWWSPGDSPAKTDHFVSALRSAGATALLAGEETHGTVPGVLVDSCREHGVPLLSVPAQTSFRAITEAVYLRQWGDLSRRPAHHYALPENVRTELARLLADGAGPDELLDRAFAHLGRLPCYLLAAGGRTLGRTPSAPELPVQRAAALLRDTARDTTRVALRIEADSGPYDTWHLYLPDPAEAPPRVLHEIADVMAQYRHALDRHRAAERRTADELLALVDSPVADATALDSALTACGLPAHGHYRVIVATLGAYGSQQNEGTGARAALTEALSHAAAGPFAVGLRPGGAAVAVLHTGQDGDRRTAGRPAVDQAWSLLHACAPETPLHAGISDSTPGPSGLNSALGQARYALAAAATADAGADRVTAVDDLTSLDALLAGIPTDVRTAFSANALGPLSDSSSSSHRVLLETLEAFLDHNCSWTRTAEALHLHVNTVHYRIQRVEALTGRGLSNLDDKLDLHAALKCR
ncbi:PucR family transcriptional regulator [Streptomyces sp. NBC_00963]|uniref:PucR family transcriptional regulator n=1 Tax=unclassified Streptomyces TaxID=2593676 RepID=UPI00386A9F39|nr:PucR family transcriptional regulator [Streptomyces sp. NBC_00963]WSX69974.1 PucR family transcriptional regulator [Streptomyces sp. NBC_00932]